MMRRILLFGKDTWFFLVFVTVLFTVTFYASAAYHESVHETIYESYGVDSEVKIKMLGWGGGSTTPLQAGCDEACEVLHLQNEIVGYNLQPVMLALLAILSVLVMIWLKN